MRQDRPLPLPIEKGTGANCMTAEIFIDTNILLYAQSRHPAEADKRTRAREVMKAGRIGLSAQVLGEFYVNATKKLSPP